MRHLTYLLVVTAFVAMQAQAQTSIDKLVIGTGNANLITLQSGGLTSGPQTITIPDPGAAANVILSATASSQTIAGPLTINATSPNYLTLTGIASGTPASYLALDGTNHVISVSGTGAITGSGTMNDIPYWSGTAALGNSLLADNSTQLTYNTSKLTVQSSSGNTAIAGTLSVGSTVTLSSVASATPSFLIGLNASNQVVETAVPSAGTLTGGGTSGDIAKWTGASALGNSLVSDNGTLLNYDAGKFVDTAATGGAYVAGTFHTDGGVVYHTSTYSSATTAASSDSYIVLTGSSAFTLSVPATNLGAGQVIIVTNNNSAACTVFGASQAGGGVTNMYLYTGSAWVKY